ncbi:MAG: sigma-70 family RNA polymerase sigma factor [Ruminococcus sp.]|nr:sigma-70 family RNA polymerase sigma factor [Ruminococcus sp.]
MTHSEYRLLLRTDKEKAQRRIFDEYYNYVYTIVYSRLRSCAAREDIDECVSDVFADVFSSYDPDKLITGDIKGFIGMIAGRDATDFYRRICKAPVTLPIDEEGAAEIPSGEDVIQDSEQKELRAMLLGIVESLGEPDSTIIIQKYFYKRTSKEIAETVPLSPVMIRVRSSRALKKLRKMLSDKDITI